MSKTLFRAFHITDLHLSPLNKAPQSRTETYNEDVKFELQAFTEIVLRENPDLILCSGDWFHLKSQGYYTPADVLHYADIITKWDRPIISIPGNHDLPKSSFDLIKHTAYDTLDYSVSDFIDISRKPFWFSKQDFHIDTRIYGVPYYPLDRLFQELPKLDQQMAQDPEGLKIVLLHPDALPLVNGSMPFQVCSWDDLTNALPLADVICLGHIHTSYPVRITPSRVTGKPQFISKPWSFGRVVKDYHATSEVLELQHRPMYSDLALVEDNGTIQLTVEYKPIPFIPFDKAFNPESLRREIENSGRISSFISSLRQEFGSVEEAFKIDSPEEYLERANLSIEIRQLINDYLNR